MKRLLATVVLVGAATSSAEAQTPDPRLVSTASVLRRGSTIRVASPAVRMEGRVVHASADSLSIVNAASERRIAIALIDTLWTRQRNTRPGAVVGAAVGGFGLAVLAGLFVGGTCDNAANQCRDDYPVAIGAGLALGAAGGALSGAAIGALTHRWRRLYP